MSGSVKGRAAQAANRRERIEANPTQVAGAVAVRLTVRYLEKAGASLPSDAQTLLQRLQALPIGADNPAEWARAVEAVVAGYRLPTPEALASRSTVLSLTLRAVNSALAAGSGDPVAAARELLISGFMSGALAGALGGLALDGVDATVRTDFAKAGAAARWKNDPKSTARAKVEERWKDWQSGKELHKSQAAFARAMVQEFPDIASTNTVENWSRSWSKSQREARHAPS